MHAPAAAANGSLASSLYYNVVEPTLGVLSDVTSYWFRRCVRVCHTTNGTNAWLQYPRGSVPPHG
jgi:hypothetical protein